MFRKFRTRFERDAASVRNPAQLASGAPDTLFRRCRPNPQTHSTLTDTWARSYPARAPSRYNGGGKVRSPGSPPMYDSWLPRSITSGGTEMATTSVNNGVNVQALLDAREALKGAPGATKFTWKASSTWKNGTYSRTTIQKFHGLGQEQSHKHEFSFDADHPEIFAAEDRGVTPVEFLLVGLASCLTAGIAAVAQNRGIQLRSVEADV